MTRALTLVREPQGNYVRLNPDGRDVPWGSGATTESRKPVAEMAGLAEIKRCLNR